VIGVFLLDDHELVRRGVRRLLESEGDIAVVGEAGTAAEALRVVAASAPDVAVLDVRLPDGNGVEVCRDIRAAHPDVRCLMLTSLADEQAVYDAILAGASGYVLKQIRTTRRSRAMRSSGCATRRKRTSGWGVSPPRSGGSSTSSSKG
jgi:two-component system, NarL family, response regulator DevR